MRRPVAAKRARARELLAMAETRRDRSAAQRGVPWAERATWRVAVLPRNRDVASLLPDQRRIRSEQNLRTALSAARARLANGEPARGESPARAPRRRPARSEELSEAHATLLAAGCATCRGFCCRQGGDHAFIDGDTMVRELRQVPDADDETSVSRYLSHLGARTMTHGCVYQQSNGCSLPRDRRADICNRYLCEGLSRINDSRREGDPVRAYFTHRGSEGFTGGRFVEVDVPRRR